MAKRGIKFEHSVGEVVLCFEPDPTKARVLYEAKVLDSQVSREKGGKFAAYLVHFQGWNNSWDRLVAESFILKASEENKALMKRLTETAKKHRKNRQRRRKIDQILRDAGVKAPAQYSSESESDSSDSDEDIQSENEDPNKEKICPENGRRSKVRRKQQPKQESPPVSIDIPDVLKARLEDDYTAVSIRGKLWSLPAKPCVVDILEGFMKTFCIDYIDEPTEREVVSKEREKGRYDKNNLKLPPENVFALCKELVDGLRIMFDFTLPIALLYATEQEQYEAAMKNAQPEPSTVHDMETACAPESKPRRGRPPGQKVNRNVREEGEETAVEMETSCPSRRLTRRSTVDSHLSDDQPIAPPLSPGKRQKKLDGTASPKLSPRTLRRRGIHDDSISIKMEENSDPEIEFSPPASTSTTNTTAHPPANQDGPVVTATESVGSFGQLHKHKEDLTASILHWNILPPEVRKQIPVMPSQVYGIHHLLRLFVKLPEFLNRMSVANHKLQVLVKLCHHCLQYLLDHQQEFYS